MVNIISKMAISNTVMYTNNILPYIQVHFVICHLVDVFKLLLNQTKKQKHPGMTHTVWPRLNYHVDQFVYQ